ncbi:uncharacterized protein [Nicotiana sylvestris]|uniref:uncharacterized protein n=1 Tax=Nicotiana sylvestris TaxID=4096 RepID=UPI00388C3F5B
MRRVLCEKGYVGRRLWVNIFPLSTLQRIEIGTERIRLSNVCVRAFDGIKRDTIGEIDLILTIGPVDFEVTFQVLDMDTSYNFLLGRPWIHAAGVVPSTLHQMVKFDHEDQEIVVHGEDEKSIYWDPSVPCLEVREGSEHIVYQAFEIVVADQYEEGNPCPKPFLSNASIMVAKEMIRRGFKPGKGLVKSLQGITEPVTLTASERFFGIGFRPTLADVKWANDIKNDGWVLPQPVPHLSNNAALNNMTCLRTSCPDLNVLSNFEIMNQESEYDEEEAFEEINRELEQYENKPKLNLNDIEPLTSTCEPIFKLVKKDAAVKWTDKCQGAFDKIKEYLSNLPVLVPLELGRPLFLYLTVLENSFGCILGQHDATGKREQAIYYLSKKFTSYEAKYTLLERTYCALTWVAQKLRHYLQAYTTYLITRLDPLKYIFQKPMPTGRLAKWQILLMEFDIVYVTCTTMKAQALADHLAENSVDDEYQPLNTYFPDEEVNSGEGISEDINAWKMFFDGVVNAKGVGIGAILISPTGNAYIHPLEIQIQERHGYCNTVGTAPNTQPLYHDIKRFLKTQEYPEQASGDQKRTIRRHVSGFFLSGDVLYKRTPDLNLLRYVDMEEAGRIMHESFDGRDMRTIQDNAPELYSLSAQSQWCHRSRKQKHQKDFEKMIQSSKQCHEKSPFALLGYRTTVRTSIGATSYLLVYGTEAVILAEVEIPSLRIIVEAEIDDSEWVKPGWNS